MAEFMIGRRLVGDGHPPVVIAEIGINHEGDVDLAIAMAEAAINAGGEIIKHQTHVVDDEMSDEAKKVIPGNADVSIYEIMRRCALSEKDELTLMRHIQGRGAEFLSTPFSRAAADRLKSFGVSAYKIGSGECNNYPLVRHIARAGKPVILSTGMNDLNSVQRSVDILRAAGVPFALLHCTNVYPTPHHLVRLSGVSVLKEAFPDAVVGLSDHSVDNFACLGAVVLGASILERHFTDSMARPGPDIVCSMDPGALRELISGTKAIFVSLGEQGIASKAPVPEELPTIAFAFASVVAVADVPAGGTLSEENIWVKRPSGGDFTAADYDGLLGRRLVHPIANGDRLSRRHLGGEDE
jgi:N-acetylneuraminate synthase